MTKRTWIIFILAVTLLLGGLIAYSRKDSPNIDTSKIDGGAYQQASAENGGIADHAYGSTDSKVVVVEYGDFQCPSCATNAPKFNAIAEAYKDKITFVFRNYPLTSIHPNALAAASVAEAAGLQGKYWEMHDLLYNKQAEWSSLPSDKRLDKFTEYAQQLGLNIDQFKIDIASENVSKKISYDQALGRKKSLTGTPSIFINGKVVDSTIWSNEADFKKLIDEEVAKAQASTQIQPEQ